MLYGSASVPGRLSGITAAGRDRTSATPTAAATVAFPRAKQQRRAAQNRPLNAKRTPVSPLRQAEPTDRGPAPGQRAGPSDEEPTLIERLRRQAAPPVGAPACRPAGWPGAPGRAGAPRSASSSRAPRRSRSGRLPRRPGQRGTLPPREGGEPLGAGASLKPAVGHARLMASSAFLASYV